MMVMQYASMPLSETLNLKLNNKQIKMLINSGQEKVLKHEKINGNKSFARNFLSFNGHIVKLLTQGEGKN